MISSTRKGSVIVPSYSSGEYFATLSRPGLDENFKATAFLRLFLRVAQQKQIDIRSYIDVGCGSGGTAEAIAKGLRRAGHKLSTVKGYDVSPHVVHLRKEGMEFVHEDFCCSDEEVDLATLFDVFEHVPDPIQFIKDVAARCKVLALHVPLDNSLANAVLNRFRARLKYPGHLIFLDTASALNLLSMAGLMVLDYQYTLGFLAPSGRETAIQKIALPFRWLVSRINPWLVSRTLGGVSLMIVAVTPLGLKEIHLANCGPRTLY